MESLKTTGCVRLKKKSEFQDRNIRKCEVSLCELGKVGTWIKPLLLPTESTFPLTGECIRDRDIYIFFTFLHLHMPGTQGQSFCFFLYLGGKKINKILRNGTVRGICADFLKWTEYNWKILSHGTVREICARWRLLCGKNIMWKVDSQRKLFNRTHWKK